MVDPHDAARLQADPGPWLAQARDLVPLLAREAKQAAAECRLTKPVVGALREAGFFRLLQPSHWGGAATNPASFYQVQKVLAEGDMSAAWVTGVLGTMAWGMGLADPRAQEDVWGANGDALVCGVIRRAGTAVPAPGGWRLSGRWPYGTGCDHADWALLGGIIQSDTPNETDQRLFLVPRAAWRQVDTWDAAGLRGTGTDDLLVQDVFVPAHRTLALAENFACRGPGQALTAGPLWRLPFGLVFAGGVTTPATGALQAMLTGLQDYVHTRKRANYQDMATATELQEACAEAAAVIDDNLALLRRAYATLLDLTTQREALPVPLRLQTKYQLSRMTDRCRAAALALVEVSGTAGMSDQYPFARLLTDIITGRQHVSNQTRLHARDWGRVLAGNEAVVDYMI